MMNNDLLRAIKKSKIVNLNHTEIRNLALRWIDKCLLLDTK